MEILNRKCEINTQTAGLVTHFRRIHRAYSEIVNEVHLEAINSAQNNESTNLSKKIKEIIGNWCFIY